MRDATPADTARPMAAARKMMIRATADLLQRRGYHGTGVAEILAKSGAPRGSLYHHFPGGKRQLVIEAIDYSARRFARDIDTAAAGAKDLEQLLDALIALSKRDLIATNYESGCPIATVSLDVPADEHEILHRCSEGFEDWAAAIAAGLAAAGLADDTSKSLGRLFLGFMLGATITARAKRDATAIDEAGAQFSAIVLCDAARVPQGSAGSIGSGALSSQLPTPDRL